MNPLLVAALIASLCVALVWSAANLPRKVSARRRRRQAARRGGVIDFSRRRL